MKKPSLSGMLETASSLSSDIGLHKQDSNSEVEDRGGVSEGARVSAPSFSSLVVRLIVTVTVEIIAAMRRKRNRRRR
jgi:hypothetical protein